jgi:AcrR family transcriptional regulator
VVEAFLALIEEGDHRPTARAIAARAGVSLRSVFQHFDDVEQIYAVAGVREMRRVAQFLRPIDSRLPLPKRLDAFVACRRQFHEALDPVARAARLREPFSAQLQANRDQMHEAARRQCKDAFWPELRRLPTDGRTELLDALAASASWCTWYCLCEEMHLSPERAAKVLRTTLGRLLEARADSPAPETYR